MNTFLYLLFRLTYLVKLYVLCIINSIILLHTIQKHGKASTRYLINANRMSRVLRSQTTAFLDVH